MQSSPREFMDFFAFVFKFTHSPLRRRRHPESHPAVSTSLEYRRSRSFSILVVFFCSVQDVIPLKTRFFSYPYHTCIITTRNSLNVFSRKLPYFYPSRSWVFHLHFTGLIGVVPSCLFNHTCTVSDSQLFTFVIFHLTII